MRITHKTLAELVMLLNAFGAPCEINEAGASRKFIRYKGETIKCKTYLDMRDQLLKITDEVKEAFLNAS